MRDPRVYVVVAAPDCWRSTVLDVCSCGLKGLRALGLDGDELKCRREAAADGHIRLNLTQNVSGCWATGSSAAMIQGPHMDM